MVHVREGLSVAFSYRKAAWLVEILLDYIFSFPSFSSSVNFFSILSSLWEKVYVCIILKFQMGFPEMLWVSDQIVQAYLRGRGTFAIVSSCWMKLRFSIKVEEIPLWVGGTSGWPVGTTGGEPTRHAHRSVLCCCSKFRQLQRAPYFHSIWLTATWARGLGSSTTGAGSRRPEICSLPAARGLSVLPVTRADPGSLVLGGR